MINNRGTQQGMNVAALSKREWDVLRACRLDARLSASDIAKRCGMRSHTVGRTLGSLKDRGILRPFVLINPHALGLTDFCVFLHLSGDVRRAKNIITQLCEKSQLIAYASELSGQYQFSISIFAASVFHVEEFLTDLEKKLSKTHVASTFAVRLAWNLITPGRPKDRLVRTQTASQVEIDDLDYEFLTRYSKNPQQAFVHIARELDVSEGSIRNRFSKLVDAKVIVGVPYLFDPTPCGLFPFRALLQTRGSRTVIADKLFELAATDDRITQTVHCLGAWDFEVNFFVKTPLDVSNFTQSIYDTHGDAVHSITTISELAVHTIPRFAQAG